MAEPKMRVKAIHVYPIKSLRGLTLPSCVATYRGFQHDRSFCLQEVSTGKHMSVAKFTEMCLFTQHLIDDEGKGDGEVFEVRYSKNHAFSDDSKAVSDESLRIKFEPEIKGLEGVEVNMHQSPVTGYDMGGKYSKWFSERFGYEVRLLYIGENRRKVLGNLPPNVAGRQKGGRGRGEGLRNTADGNGDGKENVGDSGNGWLGGLAGAMRGVVGSVVGGVGGGEFEGVDRGIGFADVAPYLVINTKSWENASRRLPEGEEMEIVKFRPNIIVEGAEEEFEEDFWAELQIGEGKLVMTQNCARCNSLNVDFETGKVGEGEKGKMLKKLQSDRRVDLGTKYSPVFGRYGFLARTKLAEEQGSVELKVGDEVKVVKRNDERTRFEYPGISTNS